MRRAVWVGAACAVVIAAAVVVVGPVVRPRVEVNMLERGADEGLLATCYVRYRGRAAEENAARARAAYDQEVARLRQSGPVSIQDRSAALEGLSGQLRREFGCRLEIILNTYE